MRDIDIRKELHGNILSSFYEDSISVVVDELPVCNGKSIVDIAVINGSLHGFEIKSAHDSLERLPSQMENYGKVFDYMTIVAGKKHIERVKEIVPFWWGIWSYSSKDSKLEKKEIQKAKRNPSKDAFSIAQFLWRGEVLEILTQENLIQGYKTKRRWLLWERAANNIPLEELESYVRMTLKKRPNWKVSKFAPM